MPVPSYDTFMLPLLRALEDGKEHENRELRDRVAGEFKPTGVSAPPMGVISSW